MVLWMRVLQVQQKYLLTLLIEVDHKINYIKGNFIIISIELSIDETIDSIDLLLSDLDAYVYLYKSSIEVSIAMERLLKQNNSLGANNIYYNIESGNIIKTKPPTTVIFESSKLDDELKQNLKEVNGKLEQDSSVNIIFNDTPIISEIAI